MTEPARPDSQDQLKRALVAIKSLRAKVEELERAKHEPVAVIGLGCRLPGGAVGPEAFWELLARGGDAVREVPPDRWSLDRYYDPNPDAAGKVATRWGGFIDDVDRFDAQFFGIAPREATSLDPQQRLFLEVSWEALENAGLAPDKLLDSDAGVFLGISTNDYQQLLIAHSEDGAKIDAYYGTGCALSVASGRLSYVLGLKGPSLVVDTACSSSLVAVHLAVNSLRAGECSLAIAGGVNVMLSPGATINFSRAHMMAVDGRCKTFDAAADGYVRGEGCGAVVLKRLSSALADGDRILAVIRGTAVNQDGKSGGLTAPNGPSQQAVIRRALQDGGAAAADVNYVEAHGTGTSLGDPIEARALAAALCEGRPASDPLTIGSVKTNIGHLEAAAGAAGLIKVVLSLQHEELPQQLHFRSINPHIPLDQWPLQIATRRLAWKRGQRRRIAGVSSFGFSGTNAHVIVEEAPLPAELESKSTIEPPAHVLALSAKTLPALAQMAANLQAHVESHPQDSLADVAFTQNVGRAQFAHRAAIVFGDRGEFTSRLAAVAAEKPSSGVQRSQEPARTTRPKIAFLFTGQGSQYAGMGRELHDTQPVFRQALDECAKVLDPLLPQQLLSVLYPAAGGKTPLDETAFTQPALFALEYALAQLWRSFGIEPAAVLGHSVGEYAAACVAGVFGLEDGLRLIAARARLMGALPAGGKMAAVFASPERVERAVAKHAREASVAAYNGPQNVVISGTAQAVDAILSELAREEVRSAPLVVSHAFHSPSMEPMLGEFERTAAGVAFRQPTIKLVSNRHGQVADPDLLASPEYWRRHVRDPVRFAEGIASLAAQGIELFVEIGPSPVLLGMARRCLSGEAAEGMHWLPSLRQGRSDWQVLLESLSTLYVQGAEVDWRGFDSPYRRRKLALPTYPFQRQRHWLDTSSAALPLRAVASAAGEAAHPLLGSRLRSALPEAQFESHLSTTCLPYLADHRVYGRVVLPAAAYLEMALAAATSLPGKGAWQLEQLLIQAPLLLSETPVAVQVVVSPPADGAAAVKILSQRSGVGAWTLHAAGQLRQIPATQAAPEPFSEHERDLLAARCQDRISKSAYYQRLHEQGLEYGASFQGIEELRRRDGEAWGQLQLPAPLAPAAGSHRLHPSLLDACFQLFGAAMPAGTLGKHALVPVGLETYRVHSPGAARLQVQVRLRDAQSVSQGAWTGDCFLYDDEGRVAAEVLGLRLAQAPRELFTGEKAVDPADWLYELKWQAAPPIVTDEHLATTGTWLVLADGRGIGQQLAAKLKSRSERCVLVFSGAGYCCKSAERFIVNPLAPADFASLLKDLSSGDLPALRGVVHLCGLDASDIDDLPCACGGLLHLLQGLAQLPAGVAAPKLWVVTQGGQSLGNEPNDGAALQPAQAALWGLARTAALELPDLGVVRVDLDPANRDAASLASDLLQEMWNPDREDQVLRRGDVRYAARLIRSRFDESQGDRGILASLPPGAPYRLEIPRRGVLDNIVARPLVRRAPGKGEVEIDVRATGLNFRDVLNVLGLYPGDPGPLGGECAGVVATVGDGVTSLAVGDEVLGIASCSFASYVTTPAVLLAKKPASMSFEAAATIPITFLTAHYALTHLAKLQAGDRVLVQAASGGVGLAALQLAKRIGAEVIGTAGSDQKRDYLRSLGVQHVFSSRTTDFAEGVKQLTGGAGVKAVLNSLAGDFIPKGLSITSPGGHFLEIGKAEILTATQAAAINPNCTYRAIALDQMVVEDPAHVGRLLGELMPLFASGELQPLVHRSFAMAEVGAAFRHMAQAKHIGKVVVTGDRRGVSPATPKPIVAVRADGAYLITGGLGSLGLLTARWLASQGAKHLALVGRRGPSEVAQSQLAALRESGVQVKVIAADLSQAAETARLLKETAAGLPPLAGVVHAAGVLDDGVLLKQDWSRFERVFGPKVQGAWHLHEQTRELPLDFFVTYSSIASLLGSPGQGNYAAANAYLDGLAQARRQAGLPALSVNWGPWAESGMAATRDERDQRRWQAQGITPIPTREGFELLGQLLQRPEKPQIAVFPVDWRQWSKTVGKVAQRPLFSEVAQAKETGGVSPQRELILASPAATRGQAVENYLRDQVARILQIPADQLGIDQPLKTAGLDSLMAIELKNLVETALQVEIPAVKLLEGPTIAQLAAEVTPQLAGEEPAAAAPAQAQAPRGEWIAYRQPRPEARLRLFCFHYLGGGASAFHDWQDLLPPEIEVCPVQLPGREERISEPAPEQLLPLAKTLAVELAPLLDRPFALYGHSMGALIAFEFARQVRERTGAAPAHLFAGGYFAPHLPSPFRTRKAWTDAELMQSVRDLLDAPEAVLENEEFMRVLLPTIRADLRLVGSYEYRPGAPLDCPITACGGMADTEVGRDDLEQWRRHTSGAFRLAMFPGKHLFLHGDQEELLALVREELAVAMQSPASAGGGAS